MRAGKRGRRAGACVAVVLALGVAACAPPPPNVDDYGLPYVGVTWEPAGPCPSDRTEPRQVRLRASTTNDQPAITAVTGYVGTIPRVVTFGPTTSVVWITAPFDVQPGELAGSPDDVRVDVTYANGRTHSFPGPIAVLLPCPYR